MKDPDKMLKLMKFWLFGTFVIIFAAAAVYVGGVLGTGLLILGQWRFWAAMLIAAVLCIAWYYIYKSYIT
ncbi:MAG: hypothetical protein J7L73_09680, partial [Anaerolineales bacterium]|nr:hypothetical protein [Anaerolineales bacterium]